MPPHIGPGKAKPRRYVRKTTPRARSETVLQMRRILKKLPPRRGRPIKRPRTRADCEDGLRPCPFVGCKHCLYLDANPETGTLKYNYPELEPWEMGESCALDVADRGGLTLEQVGTLMRLTRERVRQCEVRATARLRLLSLTSDGLGLLPAHPVATA
jgi:hypothetical protein